MMIYIFASLLLITGLGIWLRARQLKHYSRLQSLCIESRRDPQTMFSIALPEADFTQRLTHIDQVLNSNSFQALAAEIEALTRTERSYVPHHKKGGTIAYETLCEKAPGVFAFYQSEELRALISRLVGTSVVPTPLHDQSSCSVLSYEHPGDHIGWHYDHNFYRGRHFTALVPIVNRGQTTDQPSSARLMARLGDGERVIDTMPNSLVVFEGAKVLHKVTPIQHGERRIVLSMTFTQDPSNAWYQGVARRIKDTAFYGLRALWT